MSVSSPQGPGFEIRCGETLRAYTGDPIAAQALLSAVLPEGDRRLGLEILVRGLGTGAALRAALLVKRVHQVTVVEPEPALVRWNRRFFDSEPAMADPRVQVVVGAFREFLQGVPHSYDAIALDYSTAMGEGERELTPSLAAVLRTRLRPQGMLAVLGPPADRAMGRVLRETFGDVTEKVLMTRDAEGRQSERLLHSLAQDAKLPALSSKR